MTLVLESELFARKGLFLLMIWVHIYIKKKQSDNSEHHTEIEKSFLALKA